MNTTVKKWNEYLVGVFTEDWDVPTPAIVNKNDVVQFYLKILSSSPDDFPKKIKNVTCYANLLTIWGFQDKRENTNIERTEHLRDFLRESLIVFQPEQRNDFIIAKDIFLIPKTESFSYTSTLKSIPIFNGYKKEEFEKRWIKKEFFQINEYFEHEDKNIPFVVFEDEIGELFLYGPIEYVEKKEEGVRFHATKGLQCLHFKEKWLQYCSSYHPYLFVADEAYSEIIQEFAESFNGISANIDKTEKGIEILENNDEECTFINHFHRLTKVNHFHYDLKDLINFHTSLKASNLVILSGMSGTGKSKLVKMYGKALGLKKDQVLSIKVRPSWIDDSDLIGYLDAINRVYYSGDSGLVELLIRASQHPEKMYLVCFEEMNLARVEHYFSQFLSILESDERLLTLYHAHDEWKDQIVYPSSIPIGRNVLFVGTVNIDESTYVFSDKVLDRANLITLNVMPFSHLLDVPIDERDHREEITSSIFKDFYHKGEEKGLSSRELDCLWDIHTLLQESSRNFGVGWRIIHQINEYMKQLPYQNLYSREIAFDTQILQRIFPKLRGSEVLLKDVVGEYNMQVGIVEHSKLIEVLEQYKDVSSFPLSKKGIVQKAKETKLNGFTI